MKGRLICEDGSLFLSLIIKIKHCEKNAFALMVAVATLFSLGFASCSGDDDEPSVSNGEIYGMWETDYLDCWETYDGVLDSDSQEIL